MGKVLGEENKYKTNQVQNTHARKKICKLFKETCNEKSMPEDYKQKRRSYEYENYRGIVFLNVIYKIQFKED